MASPEGRRRMAKRGKFAGVRTSCRANPAGEREAVYRNQATESMFCGPWLALTETRQQLKCAIREVG
jgi:hypothetical protein